MATAGSEGSRGWRWRPKGTSPPPERLLLYEPGNRGDLLKSAWLAVIADRLSGAGGRAVADLCAGAPSYPLSPAARSLRERAPPRLRALLESAAGEERWPASGLLLHRARAEVGAPGPLRVFDRDPARLLAWRVIAGAEPLAGESGEELLGAIADALPRDLPALVLIDPYDLFHRLGPWRRPLERLLPAAPALLYLYNKSPRGEGHLDQYRRVRATLESLGGEPPLVGRLASDEREPRALHEVWLFAGAALRGDLRDPLAVATAELLARFPGEAGFPAFEG
jgi:hypothetical protein